MENAYLLLAALVGAVMGAVSPYVAARLVELRTKEHVAPSRPRVMTCTLISCVATTSIALLLGPVTETVAFVALVAPLVTAALTDLDAWIIPRECVWAVLAVRLLYLGATFVRGGAASAGSALSGSLLGIFAVGLPLLVASAFMERTQHVRESLGGGDVRLFLAMGAVFGWSGASLALILACLFGIVHFAVCYQQKGEGGLFPFAPSIALACWATALGQPALASLAVRLFA